MTEERRSGDDPVFPNDADPSCFGFTYGRGLSKRDHYAALFVAGLLANASCVDAHSDFGNDHLVNLAIDYADRLVKKLGEADRGDA